MVATKKQLRGLQYLDHQTAEHFASDAFVDPEFVWSGTDRDEYEGWFNEATFLFNQYFMQEPKLQKALGALIKKDGMIPTQRAINLFKYSGIRIDARIEEYADQYVSAHEIVKDFLATLKEANDVEKS
jgi:hypothetical protein